MRYLLCVFLCVFAGCSTITVPKETAIVAADVSRVQAETSDSLINSINDELKITTDAKKIEALTNLRDRLDYLKRANKTLSDALCNQLSMEELAAIIKERTKLQEN